MPRSTGLVRILAENTNNAEIKHSHRNPVPLPRSTTPRAPPATAGLAQPPSGGKSGVLGAANEIKIEGPFRIVAICRHVKDPPHVMLISASEIPLKQS